MAGHAVHLSWAELKLGSQEAGSDQLAFSEAANALVLGDIDLLTPQRVQWAKLPSPIKAVLVLLLTVFSRVIAAVAVGMIMAAFIFMKKVADISEQQTTISPLAAEPWVDERDLAAVDRDGFPVDQSRGHCSSALRAASPRSRLVRGRANCWCCERIWLASWKHTRCRVT